MNTKNQQNQGSSKKTDTAPLSASKNSQGTESAPKKNSKPEIITTIKQKVSAERSRLQIVRCEFIVLCIVIAALLLTVLYIVSSTKFMQAYYRYKGPDSKGQYKQWNGLYNWIKEIFTYWTNWSSLAKIFSWSSLGNLASNENLGALGTIVNPYNWSKWLQYKTWISAFQSLLGMYGILRKQVDPTILLILLGQILTILGLIIKISIKLQQHVYTTLIKMVTAIKYILYFVIFLIVSVVTAHNFIQTKIQNVQPH